MRAKGASGRDSLRRISLMPLVFIYFRRFSSKCSTLVSHIGEDHLRRPPQQGRDHDQASSSFQARKRLPVVPQAACTLHKNRHASFVFAHQELAEACILVRWLTVESERMFKQIRNTSSASPKPARGSNTLLPRKSPKPARVNGGRRWVRSARQQVACGLLPLIPALHPPTSQSASRSRTIFRAWRST